MPEINFRVLAFAFFGSDSHIPRSLGRYGDNTLAFARGFFHSFTISYKDKLPNFPLTIGSKYAILVLIMRRGGPSRDCPSKGYHNMRTTIAVLVAMLAAATATAQEKIGREHVSTP